MKNNLVFFLLLCWIGSACKKNNEVKTEAEVMCTCLDLAKEIQGTYKVTNVTYQRNQLSGNYNPTDSLEQGSVDITKVDPLRVKVVFKLTTKSSAVKLNSDYQAELSRDITLGKEGQILLNGSSYTSADRKELFLTLSPTQERYGQIGVKASR